MPAPQKSVVAQTLATFASGSSGYVAAIVTGVFVARAIGPAGKGVAAYAALIMAVFTTFGNGAATAVLQRYREGQPLTLAYGTALRLIGFTMLPLAAALFLIAMFVPAHASLAYVACAVPFAVFGQVANSIFQLHNDVRSTLIQSAFTTFGLAAVTIPAVTWFHAGITGVLAIWAATFVVARCYALVRVGAYVPRASFHATWDSLHQQGAFALKAGGGGLAGFLNLRIDVFIVGIMLDVRLLGIYSLAVATGELMWQVSRPLVWTTMGRVAVAQMPRAVALTMTVTRNIFAVECILGAVIFLGAPLALRAVYGDAYAESATIVRWLLPGLIVYATQGPLAYFVTVSLGKPAATLAVQLGSLATCALLTILLVPRIGLAGAAVATSATYCFAAAAIVTLFIRTTGTSLAQLFLLQPVDLVRLARLLVRLRPRAVC